MFILHLSNLKVVIVFKIMWIIKSNFVSDFISQILGKTFLGNLETLTEKKNIKLRRWRDIVSSWILQFLDHGGRWK